jgi:sugar phosphate isomerase/epimerase
MTAQGNGNNRHRIGVSSWSFDPLFRQNKDNPPAAPMDVRDFPEMIADRYHVHNVEIVLPHFRGVEPSLVRDFKARLAKARSRLVHMPLDFAELWERPAISSTDAQEREHALRLYKKGIDAAAALECPLVRCDPGKVNLDDPSLTIDSYKQLAAYGRGKGVKVVVENHYGSTSERPEALVGILNAAGVGSLPDFENFPDEATRDRGLELLFPIAGDVAHAKMREGRDFGRVMQIAKASGFAGIYSIEAEHKGDVYVRVQEVVDALLDHL